MTFHPKNGWDTRVGSEGLEPGLLIGVSLQVWLTAAVSDDTVQGLPGAGLDVAVAAGGGALGQALRGEGWLLCTWPACLCLQRQALQLRCFIFTF